MILLFITDAQIPSCVGAGDGTLIPLRFKGGIIGTEPWRWRKGYYAQNVLLCFSYDKTITFASVMNEGCTHDSAIITHYSLDEIIPGL